jgi:GDPmannose 4,6-dehydratase
MQDCLYLGNLDARRDWGHAKDYVEMQWLMLQQEKPEDFVIATGEQHSVREFATAAAGEVGIKLRWKGKGAKETAIAESVSGAAAESRSPSVDQTLIRVDPRYFRPTEVDALLGDPSKARTKLKWKPKVRFADLVKEMAREDLALAQRDRHLSQGGFKVNPRPD